MDNEEKKIEAPAPAETSVPEEPKEEKAEEGCGCGHGCCCGDKDEEECEGGCCESDCGCECGSCSRKKKGLVLTSAIAALVGATGLFYAAFYFFFNAAGKGYIISAGVFALVAALAIMTFGVFSLLHLATGKFSPKCLFPVTGIAYGGYLFLTNLVNLCYGKTLGYGAEGYAAASLRLILGAALVALGILAIVLPKKREKCGKLFFVLSDGLTLFALLLLLIGDLTGSNVLAFDPTYLLCLGLGLTLVLGLVITLGEGRRTLKEEKQAAEAVLAYKELLDRDVITEEEFEDKKEEILH